MEDVTKWEQLKPRMQMGDYNQVALILGATRDAVKMRLRRGNPEALSALEKLIESREALRAEFQNSES